MGEGRSIVLFRAVGGCLLLVALVLSLLRLHFIHHAKSAEGIVNPVSTGGTHVTIEFATASGKKSWFITSGEVATHPGQSVQVLYREGLNPSWYPDGVDACMASPSSLWYLPARLAVLGGGFFVVGMWGSSIERLVRALRPRLRKP